MFIIQHAAPAADLCSQCCSFGSFSLESQWDYLKLVLEAAGADIADIAQK